jgi:hypothetical protein
MSYAHEDQELMLALVEQLQTQGLDIRYDQIVLNIGDSLIEKISSEITDGDFVIAVVSPDSVASPWCQRELSLAATDGINQQRVKVLPIKFRQAEMPPMLRDTYWADADSDNVETLARKLAAAMLAHLGGRGEEAEQAAEQAEEAEGEPAHAEAAGDVGVAQIEEVAQRAWDVFQAWTGVWNGGNVRDLDDPQRRLRWAIDALPERVRQALPLVQLLANSDWDEFFADEETREAERRVREELLAVRTRVAQGLPIVRRWLVASGGERVDAGNRDASAYLWGLRRGEERRNIVVFISGTVMESANEGLPEEVAAAKNTAGRSVMSTLVGFDDPPRQVMVTTAGVSLTLPD